MEEALEQVGARHPPFSLRFGGVGAFPDMRRPRVVWMGIEASPALLALQRDVASALEGLGFDAEAREYSPHLTMGRAEQGARASAFSGFETRARDVAYRATVEFGSVDLMRSHIGRAGARYERLLAAPLGGVLPQ
jgi:2'-5' RNA ligase